VSRLNELLDELDTIAANIATYDYDDRLGAGERAMELMAELRELLNVNA
jgi:hypothetical protein